MSSANYVAPLVGSAIKAQLRVREQTRGLLTLTIARAKEGLLDPKTEPMAIRALVQACAQAFDMWAQASMLPGRPKQIGRGPTYDIQTANVIGEVRSVARAAREEK